MSGITFAVCYVGGILAIVGIVVFFLHAMSVNGEHATWRTQRKRIEAEGIMAEVEAKDDAWMVRHEARVRAHDVMKPDTPWWAVWLA